MIMGNKHPEIMDHIKLASFLAPIGYMDHMTSPLRFIAPFVDELEVRSWILNYLITYEITFYLITQWILNFLGHGEFLPSNALMDWLAGFFCHEGNIQGICSNILFVLCGFDEAQVRN